MTILTQESYTVLMLNLPLRKSTNGRSLDVVPRQIKQYFHCGAQTTSLHHRNKRLLELPEAPEVKIADNWSTNQ
jgi:hypothetical protein